MSNILNQLKALQALIKTTGEYYNQYALIKNGTLYFNNNVIQITCPFDLPFDCCINIHQLLAILNNIKQEYVVIKQDNCVIIKVGDIIYNIDIYPDFTNMLDFYDLPDVDNFIECDKPIVFKELMSMGEHFVTQPISENSVKHIVESLLIYDNNVIFSNKKNIIQGVLDFSMPNLSFTLDVIVNFNKIAKKADIVGMNFIQGKLVVALDNGLYVFLKDNYHISNETAEYAKVMFDKVINAMNKYWAVPTIDFPLVVKDHLNLLNKLNNSNVIYITNSFCKAGDKTISFPSFTDDLISFRFMYKDFKIFTKFLHKFVIRDQFCSFVNEQGNIRGLVGGVLDD